LAQRWGAAFSQEYQAATSPADAVADIDVIEAMEAQARRSTCG
jgi:NAD-specific glutamate dehydrogenase